MAFVVLLNGHSIDGESADNRNLSLQDEREKECLLRERNFLGLSDFDRFVLSDEEHRDFDLNSPNFNRARSLSYPRNFN